MEKKQNDRNGKTDRIRKHKEKSTGKTKWVNSKRKKRSEDKIDRNFSFKNATSEGEIIVDGFYL